MFQLVLGWKSHSTYAEPEVIYAGPSGDERIKAVTATAGKGYVRAQLLVNPIGIPVQLPDNAPKEASTEAPTPEPISKPTKKK